MVLLLVLAPVLLPEFKNASAGRFDLLSSALSLGAVLTFIYGVKDGAANGYGLVALAALTLGIIVGAVFLRRQRRLRSPMIDLAMFDNRRFSGGIVANSIAMFALVGNAIFVSQYLQLVLGLSPFAAALWSLAPSVLVAAAAPVAQALGRRYNQAHVMSGGFLLAGTGFLVLTQVHANSHLALLLTGAGLLSTGLVAVMTLVTELVVGAVAPERAGSAAALLETGSELGGALGIAILGSIGAATFHSALTDQLPDGIPAHLGDVARDGLPGAVATAQGLPDTIGTELLTAAREAFSQGLNVVAVAGAVILVGAAIMTGAVLGRVHARPVSATSAA
jgi:DHA2 family multidrug resistance protein-like MFS transporter